MKFSVKTPMFMLMLMLVFMLVLMLMLMLMLMSIAVPIIKWRLNQSKQIDKPVSIALIIAAITDRWHSPTGSEKNKKQTNITK